MAKTFGPRYDSDIPEGHAFAETRDLKPDDRLLRRHGFKIKSRPARGPVTWTKGGEEYVQEEALRIAARGERDVQKKEQAQDG